MIFKFVIILIVLIFLFLIVSGFVFVATRESKNISNLRFVQMSPNEMHVYYSQNNFYTVQYVPKKQIAPLFGEARNEFGNEIALVRNDLPKDMIKFVTYHELYHLQDIKHKTKFSREINASLAAAPYSFIGFIETIFMTVVNFNRIKYYLNFNE